MHKLSIGIRLILTALIFTVVNSCKKSDEHILYHYTSEVQTSPDSSKLNALKKTAYVGNLPGATQLCSGTIRLNYTYWIPVGNLYYFSDHTYLKNLFRNELMLRLNSQKQGTFIVDEYGITFANVNHMPNLMDDLKDQMRTAFNIAKVTANMHQAIFNEYAPTYYDAPQTNCIAIPGSSPANPNPGGSPSNPDVGNINQIIEIDKSDITVKHPCWTNLISNKLDVTSGYKELLLPFATKSQKPNLTWKASNLPWGGGTTTYEGGHAEVDTTGNLGLGSIVTLNTNMINNASRLLIAAVTVHETMHAYINFEYKLEKQEALLNNSLPSYSSAYVQYYYNTKADNNFTNHMTMMGTVFDQMTSALYSGLDQTYSVNDCRMALLFGLNNPGVTTDLLYPSIINATYEALKSKYSITEAALNAFNQANVVAVPNNLKLPNSCL